MLHNSRIFQSTINLHHHHHRCHAPTPLPPIAHSSPVTPSLPLLRESPKQFSRRELAVFSNASLLLLLGRKARAEDSVKEGSGGEQLCSSSSQEPTSRAFLDISIDGKPAGRVVIGLYDDVVPVGASRFSKLVSGKAGITYRRKEFIKITSNYVQHGGVRSYGVDADLARSTTGGDLAAETLVDEWQAQNERCTVGTKNLAGSVGIIVRNPLKPPPKLKLVAKKGKLEIDEEEVGSDPNGTEFVIATKDSPELDAAALVIGRVLEGMEVVEKIGQVKTVQDNTTSPYFRVAKLIGDKRAVVAERGFNRPYSKVIVTNCGLME
ncbi:unnamed protein product [Linum trigynum]|uniref:PPIase cyclophilin-type domain-containing protein n=1 Tax=Linum trigynum TaxID=586398 RepID=A0AAV2CG24_9ROSI